MGFTLLKGDAPRFPWNTLLKGDTRRFPWNVVCTDQREEPRYWDFPGGKESALQCRGNWGWILGPGRLHTRRGNEVHGQRSPHATTKTGGSQKKKRERERERERDPDTVFPMSPQPKTQMGHDTRLPLRHKVHLTNGILLLYQHLYAAALDSCFRCMSVTVFGHGQGSRE